ncbi:MAG: hypothetical protein GY801_48030 [bacterium]|nr:hypothetical protein [bacterium]
MEHISAKQVTDDTFREIGRTCPGMMIVFFQGGTLVKSGPIPVEKQTAVYCGQGVLRTIDRVYWGGKKTSKRDSSDTC